MKLKLWGVRGSLPSPLAPVDVEKKIANVLTGYREAGQGMDVEAFLKTLPHEKTSGFGGHTACVQVSTNQISLIIDGGSGIRRLGEQMMAGPSGLGRSETHILFTHFHWDHLIGLPFFVPLFVPGNIIHAYSVQPDLEKIFRHVFQKPYFPVPYEQLGATFHFHQLVPRVPVVFKDVTVTPYQMDHPDPCWGYRLEHEGKVAAYCVDTECTRVSPMDLGPDLPMYQAVDVMVMDAQYSFLEATERVDWGHASAPIGLDLAMREGIKRVFFVHHDPAASDEKIKAVENQTRRYYEAQLSAARSQGLRIHPVDWKFAHEGLLIDV